MSLLLFILFVVPFCKLKPIIPACLCLAFLLLFLLYSLLIAWLLWLISRSLRRQFVICVSISIGHSKDLVLLLLHTEPLVSAAPLTLRSIIIVIYYPLNRLEAFLLLSCGTLFKRGSYLLWLMRFMHCYCLGSLWISRLLLLLLGCSGWGAPLRATNIHCRWCLRRVVINILLLSANPWMLCSCGSG